MNQEIKTTRNFKGMTFAKECTHVHQPVTGESNIELMFYGIDYVENQRLYGGNHRLV